MNIIIDSGSTKSDLVVIKGNHKKHYSLMGFNPIFHTSEQIFTAFLTIKELLKTKDKVENVYYYGAGCSTIELNQIVEKALKKFYINAKININNDLTASAFACFENSPIIACILGTGSNACYFDGNELVKNTPSLGYILGDEASGSYFGKKIIIDFLYKRLPKNLEAKFIKEYSIDKEIIIENIYRKANANVYLASFMKFIFQNKENNYIQNILKNGIKEFFQIHVCCYPNYQKVNVNFVGSVAYLFKDELNQVANEMEIKIGKIIQKPIEGLINYHQKNLL